MEDLLMEYGRTTIPYKLQYSARKTLGIKDNPDLSVTVTAPHTSRPEIIKRRIENKARWIVRQQEFFAEFLPQTPQREYVSGETHLYLGKQYRLKFLRSRKKEVKMAGKFLTVLTPDKSDKHTVKIQLNDWYRKHAIRIFQIVIEKELLKFKKYKLEYPPLV